MPDKILLADDSITIQKVVNLTFTDEGINVVTVGNGELAIKKLNEESFDLVLADIFMPGRNGYEVCECVKSSPEWADIPVILLVGAFEPFDKAEAARVGADGHLTKPFESRILVETVKRMLAEASARRATAAAQAQPAFAAPPPEQPQGYRGHVVGWDVPTQKVSSMMEEDSEPEPPPYDPYASTAKLPPLTRPTEPAPEPDIFSPPDAVSITHVAGSPPLPTGALFRPPVPPPAPPESGAFHFDMTGQMPPTEAPEAPPAESFGGFTFGTGPLPTEAPPPFEPPAFEPSVFERPSAPVEAPRGRDPLLETFADVAESTIRVGSAPDPAFVSNQMADASGSVQVKPVEGLTSAWDTTAQPETPPPAPVAEAEEVSSATMAYRLDDIPSVGGVVDGGSPFDLPADVSAVAPDAYERDIDTSDSTQVYRLSDMPFSTVANVEPPAPASPMSSFDFPPVAQAEEVQDLAGSTIPVPRTHTHPLSSPASSTTQRLSMDEIKEAMAEPPVEIEEEHAPPHVLSFEAPVDESPLGEEPVAEVDLDYIAHPAEPAPEEVVLAEPEPEEAAVEELAVSADESMHADAQFSPEDTLPLPVASVAEVAEERPFIVPLDDGPAEPAELRVEALPVEAHAIEETAPEALEVEESHEPVAAESVQVAVPVAPVNGSGAHAVDASASVSQSLIEEVVRRTIERINDDVIREIAWEVVPELAEQIIRKRLAENR